MMDINAQALAILWQSPLAASSVVALLLAILTLWFPTRFKLPLLFFIIYLITGLLSHHLKLIALPCIFALGVLFFIAQSAKFNNIPRIVAGVFAFILAIIFFVHAVPGMINIKVIDHAVLSYHGAPFTMYLNLDKPLVGLFILFFGQRLIQTGEQWKKTLWMSIPIAIVGFIVILGLAFILGYVNFDPKFNSVFFLWAISNLLLTAVTEEALCRGFVLHYLDTYAIRFKYGQSVSLLIVSIFFGALHYAGGWKYILLATVAGIVYGYIYQKTKRIEASILTHFLLNTLHFLLFTYPSLAGTSLN
jgi:CAAX protease family protein